MDAVRYHPNRTLTLRNTKPDRRPHRARHLPVDPANSVDRIRAAQGQSSHVKHRPAAVIIGPELQKIITVFSKCAPAARQVGPHEPKWQRVVAGSHRRLRCKKRAPAYWLKRSFETLPTHHRLPHALKRDNRRTS